MEGINQVQRSALRRALQQVFIDGTLELYGMINNRISDEEKFTISWKSMLCLVGLRTSIDTDDLPVKDIKRLLKEKNIIPASKKQTHQHHNLVRGSITKLNMKSIKCGVESISSTKLIEKLKRERVGQFEHPWEYILPEDIGSCYEIMMERKIMGSNENYELISRKDRRSSGIHHTPFDLTNHMCNLAIEKSNYSGDKESDILAIDIAHGAGAFTLQMARKISNLGRINIQEVLTKYILGFDIDGEVLSVASFCFHIEADFPKLPLKYNLFKLDSLDGKKSRKTILKKARIMVNYESTKFIFIGNPPYVEVKLDNYVAMNFEALKCRNLSAYFLEQVLKILPENSIISQVVPLSLIHSKRMKSVRQLIINKSKSIRVESFDCVPGYMFDQGKIGSNSNTAITQRIAVISIEVGEKLTHFRSSRFVRWRGDERNNLFQSIKSVQLNEKLYSLDYWPSIGSKQEKDILNKILDCSKTIKDLTSKKQTYQLYIPNSTRYFISAVHEDLNRGQKVLSFEDSKYRDLVQVLLNSDFFYWYWRITDGGFSVSLGTLNGLPLPSEKIVLDMQTSISRIARKIRSQKVMNYCRVIKSNKGDKINYKFGKDNKLMNEIDDLIHDLYELKKKYAFHAHKSNNIKGHEKQESTGLRN